MDKIASRRERERPRLESNPLPVNVQTHATAKVDHHKTKCIVLWKFEYARLPWVQWIPNQGLRHLQRRSSLDNFD